VGVRYAQIADLLAISMVAHAVAQVADEDKEAMLDSASDEATAYLRAAGYTPPLTAWDRIIVQHVANIAAYRCMGKVGYNPRAGADEVIRLNYEDAIRFFRDVQAGRAIPDVTDSAPPPPDGAGSAGGSRGTGAMVLQARERGGRVVVGIPDPRWLGSRN
jgi:phage gp36-like protein